MKKTIVASVGLSLLLLSGCGVTALNNAPAQSKINLSSNASGSITSSGSNTASNGVSNTWATGNPITVKSETSNGSVNGTTFSTSVQNQLNVTTTLQNGITVSMVNDDVLGEVPVVSKGGQIIWDARKAGVVNGDGLTNVALASDGDTYFTYESASADGGISGVTLLGIHQDGTLFLKKNFGDVTNNRFLGPSKWQVAFEVPNPQYNPATDPEADRFLARNNVKEYELGNDKKLIILK